MTGTGSACAACAFICFRRPAGRTTSAASASMSSRPFGRSCAARLGDASVVRLAGTVRCRGRLREISGEMPVVIDHMLNIPAKRTVDDPSFQTLLRLVGEGHVHAKLSAPYRLSSRFPDYADAGPFHEAWCAPIRNVSCGERTGLIRKSRQR